MSPAEVQTELDAYDGAIAYLDFELDALLNQLADRGLDNTLVIITSDHGEQFGEHGLFSHGNSLYAQTLRVPLIVVFPGHVPAHKTVPQIVSLRDVPSTILDLLNLPESPSFGNTLRHYWESDNPSINADSPILSELSRGYGQTWYPSSKGDMRSVVIDMIHYIQNGDGSTEAYDLARDPFEANVIRSNDWKQRFGPFPEWSKFENRRSGPANGN